MQDVILVILSLPNMHMIGGIPVTAVFVFCNVFCKLF